MTLRIIGGRFKGRVLKTPKTNSTRPTQGVLRGAIFNICQHEIEGARFLDLFAGSGAMGLEALSRGAAAAVFVEKNRQAVRCIQENIQTLAVDNETLVIPTDATHALDMLTQKLERFDLIYIDPPYEMSFNLALLASLLGSNGLVFLEQRDEPKKNTFPMDPPGLTLKDTRRFGSARLLIYKKTSEPNHKLP